MIRVGIYRFGARRIREQHVTTVKQETIPQPTFGEFLSAFLRIGFLSFGGPAAQIALMRETH